VIAAGHAYLHTETPPYIYHDCCDDGGKNGYYSRCDAYPRMSRGSVTINVSAHHKIC